MYKKRNIIYVQVAQKVHLQRVEYHQEADRNNNWYILVNSRFIFSIFFVCQQILLRDEYVHECH
jgi:hypothetical protein